MGFSVLEICAGAGGQAIGLEMAGFDACGAIEIDKDACATLQHNRPEWDVQNLDIKELNGKKYKGVDLFAGGVPCPPFSIAGKQLGSNDERDLFPEAIRLISESRPRAVMLENVRGFASSKFDKYRKKLIKQLNDLDYEVSWQVLNASDYGVPQLRPRFVLVGLKLRNFKYFRWPIANSRITTVADAISDILGSQGWRGISEWQQKANVIAPTVVGGSKKHGGADLGPTRAKLQWEKLGVDGKGIANMSPNADDCPNKLVRLTNPMVARIQGFPDSWEFQGGKTSQYRQIGNAFPAPVAMAVGNAIRKALNCETAANEEPEHEDLFSYAEAA